MIRPAVFCLCLVVAAAGCSSRPEVVASETPAVAASPYPTLAPIEGLLARSKEPNRAAPAERELNARAAALRARASGLRQRSLAD